MQLTWIDLNTWILHIADLTVLVDPWLVDPLVFYGFPWLFTAEHQTPPRYTPTTLPPIDLILITQGLDDHCHRPTLEQLDRKTPVIASPAAAKVVRNLGYTQVTVLSAWQEALLAGKLHITAVPGAAIQPGQLENGYLLRDQVRGITLYYEPHWFQPDTNMKQRIGKVDVAIAPVIGQVFPLLGQVIMGPQQAWQLVDQLEPQIFLPTSLGEIKASGLLPLLIQSTGSLDEFKALLANSNSSTQLITPIPGETLDLKIATRNQLSKS